MSTSQVAVILTYLIFISCCGISSYAQDLSDIDSIPTANYTIHEYDINDGLRQMQVNDIFVSRRGEIWIGTRAGVCLFDGKNFDGFEDLDVKPDYVCDIGEMADGRIVILSPKYLYFFDGKEFIPKNLSDLKLSYPSLIRTDLQNRVWINKRYSHINKIYKEGAFFDPIDLYPELKDAEVNTIWPSVTGDTIYFISDDRNLISLTEGRQKLIFKSSITMSAITEHWYTPYNTLNRVDNCIAIHERKNINEIRQLVIDLNNESVDTLYDEDVIKSSENHELFHKENDILSIVDSQLYYVIKDADIKYNTILSLYTYDGIHYIGTDKGLVICTPSQFVNYSEEKFNNVWTISEMPDGEIYFSSFSGKFVRLSDEKVIDNYNSFGIDRVYNKYFSAKFRQYYFSSAIGRNGNLYLTSNKGLIRYDGEQLHPFYPKATLGTIRPSLYVYYDKQKDIFLRATCSGVDIIDSDGNLFRKIDTTLFAHRCMLTINQTGEDLYWFGATGGIASYSFTEDTVVNYEYADNRCPIKSVICSYVDYEGNFWIGGKGGLARYDSQLDSFLIVKELQNYNVNSIIQGDKNQLFLGTIRGLLMIDPKIYLKDGVVKSRLYTSKDGMEGIELNQNGFFKDSKGHIWTTSATNVVSFDPQNLQYQKVELNPKIQKLNDKRLTYSKNKLYLDQRENTILVDYGLSKANFSKEILFRHRLDRNDWSNWTNKTTTRYSNLTSGSHRIEVEAKNVTDLNAISQIDSVEFEVDIALYQEPYFNKLLGLLILSLILAGYFFYRNYKLEKRIVQLLQTEKDKLIFEKNELTTLNENLINKIQSISKIDLVNAKQKIDITTPSKIISHKPNDITYIVAEKSGIRVYTTQGDYWSDMTIKQFVSKSSDKRFIRVYRSTVVNVSHIKWVNHVSLMMQDGSEHKIGRTYKKDIMAAFEED